ncbi:hypothetical protein [Nocardioides hwasunensis]|uniref:Acyltransferase n=1 Tax=Nocardioides hwasunensis TaxID=397258 RepID=A0ABR8MFY2_9ACTN|nr:acyltransferase [Nocardioides hwasunensis]
MVPTLVPLLVAVAILALVQQPGGRLLHSRPLRWVGRRSYAMYLWHFPLFGVAATLPAPARWPALAVAVLLTAAIAELSWRCVEEPFLRDRHTGVAAEPAEPAEPATPPALACRVQDFAEAIDPKIGEASPRGLG